MGKRSRTMTICLLAILKIIPSAVYGSCLDDAARYADNICGAISGSGSASFVDVSGNLTAEASALLRRAVGEFGGDVDVRVLRETYSNVLREDLAGELKDVRQCRMRMQEAARQEACAEPVVYKRCADPSFGVASWKDEEQFSATSKWLTTQDQDGFCNEVIRMAKSSAGINGKPYHIEVIHQREDERWEDDRTKKGKQYQYQCSVRLVYGPVYELKRDPICGVQEK